MLKRFSTNHALLCMILDGLMVMLALRLAYLVRPSMSSISDLIRDLTSPREIKLYVYFLLAVVWMAIFLLRNQYDPEKNLRVVDEVYGVIGSAAFSGVVIAGTLYLSDREMSRVLFLAFFVFSTTFCVSHRLLYRLVFRISRKKAVQERRVLIVGAGPVGRQIKERIELYKNLGYSVVGFVDDNSKLHDKFPGKILGTVQQVQQVVSTNKIDNVIIALPRSAYEKTTRLVVELHSKPVRLWVIPDYFHQALSQAKILDFAGFPLIDLRAPALSHFQRMVKRIFDLFVTIPLLIILSPLFLIVALLIAADSPGPIFYKSKRIKENGEIFGMIKFRTMKVDADKDLQQVMKVDESGVLTYKRPDDPRITKIGRVLRKYSLDELPQFINVLTGDMSLIGPRPELPELVDRYEPWQRKRFSVPQGISGWWQVNGRSDKPMHLNTEDDLYYIQNYSLGLDIQILLKTILVVIRGKGAF